MWQCDVNGKHEAEEFFSRSVACDPITHSTASPPPSYYARCARSWMEHSLALIPRIQAYFSFFSPLVKSILPTNHASSLFAGCHWLFPYASFFHSTIWSRRWLAHKRLHIYHRISAKSFRPVLKLVWRISSQHLSHPRSVQIRKTSIVCVPVLVLQDLHSGKGLLRALPLHVWTSRHKISLQRMKYALGYRMPYP